MTTTPAPTDHDAIRKHVQLAEDWAEYGHVGDPNWHVARTLIKQVPALLDELAKTRRDRDAARNEADMWQRQLDELTKSAGRYLKGRVTESDTWEKRYAEMLDQRDAALHQLAEARAAAVELEPLSARAERDAARKELAKTRAELDEAVQRRNEIQDEWARRMTLLVRLCSGNHGALTDSTLIPVAEVKRAILDAFGTDGQRALDAPTPADEIRAETLRWAADCIDPGPTATWPTPRSETWDITLSSRRGVAANLRQWAEANPATTAEPAAQHGPSAHGRACCDQLPAIMLPMDPVACGGVKACDLCREWADEIHGATTAEPADEDQDDESLFESHRLADDTMPDTIPVTDSEHDAPDGATVDGYTRQRNTWVRNAEPAAS